MVAFIQEEVRELLSVDNIDTEVVILIGVDEETELSYIVSELQASGVDDFETLPFRTIKASIKSSKLSEVVEIEGVASVEFDRDVEVAAPGN